jgi:haloacetate dehalogenase
MLFGPLFQQAQFQSSGARINYVHGGKGEPLLLIHGYPQSHVMWHLVAPKLAEHFHVICPDLRGYGDSSKPDGVDDHSNYSKRAMAQDLVELMRSLGYYQFNVAGHDRGARVTHRMMLDYPQAVLKGCVMDIAPTHYMFSHTDQAFATGYYHWFFLIQPGGLPERMISHDPDFYLKEKLRRWAAPGARFSPAAVDEYLRCFSDPDTIHASCEDYRAAATIDMEHDEADLNVKVQAPLLVLWGSKGFVHRTYDLLSVWRERAENVQGRALESGHFLPEETPDEVSDQLLKFFL